MLLSAVSVLIVAQSSSEIPEGLMNNPVYLQTYPITHNKHKARRMLIKLRLICHNHSKDLPPVKPRMKKFFH